MNFYNPFKLLLQNNTSNKIIFVALLHKSSSLRKGPKASSQAVSEAERVIGYSTSFLNLRWLLNDEVANVALHLRKLIGTNHPLLSSARNLILNKDSLSWGLIVLLISKAAGLNKKFSPIDCDSTAGILHHQRILAEVTEMIHTSNIIHKTIMNINTNDKMEDDLKFGNLISLLTGDYLLSTSFREFAVLKNHEVNEILSTCLRDLAEVQFIEPRDKQNRPLPSPPLRTQNDIQVPNQYNSSVINISNVLGNAKAEWTLRNLLDGASLLGKCCQCSLILAEHPESFQKLGYLFGRNLALAWYAHRDYEIFELGKTASFSLVNAPLLFHIQYDPTYYKQIIKFAEKDNINYEDIRKAVLSGPGLTNTIELQKEFSQIALNILEEFSDSGARTALANIINAI